MKKRILAGILALCMLSNSIVVNAAEKLSHNSSEELQNISESDEENITQTSISISTAEELLEISNNISSGKNDYKGATIVIKEDIDLANLSWKPLGTAKYPFCGSIQGNGYKISGMTCGNENSGLIGYMNATIDCKLENINITDMNLTGKYSGGLISSLSIADNINVIIRNCTVDGKIKGTSLRSGGLIGTFNTSGGGNLEVLNCDVEVSINSGYIWSDAYACVGGIIGETTYSGTSTTNLKLENCNVTGDLTTSVQYGYCSSQAGGLIGLSRVGKVTIEKCSSRATVSCKAYYAETGGFIGTVDLDATTSLDINNCYVNAAIIPDCTNGTEQGGGMIGCTWGSGGSEIHISNSYVTGSMTGKNKAAFVCWHSGSECPVIQNCYFDKDKLGIASGNMVCKLAAFSTTWLSNNISNSKGLSTAQMKEQENYNDWDFENIWTFFPEVNNGYPILGKSQSSYTGYELRIYSEFTSCTIGKGSSFRIRPLMVNSEEIVLEDVNGYAYSIEDKNLIGVSSIIYDEYGPIFTIEGKEKGTANITMIHLPTGKSITIKVTVRDETLSYNIKDLKNNSDYYLYNAELYLDNFKSVNKGNDTYKISFDVYNGLANYGAVEVYDKDGNLVRIERIDKMKKTATGLKEVWDSAVDLWADIWNGDILTYKQQSYTKKTSIELENVPNGGYIVVSNNMLQSNGAFVYNSVNLFCMASGIVADIKKSDDKDKITEKVQDDVAINFIENYMKIGPKFMEKCKKKMKKYFENMTVQAFIDVVGTMTNEIKEVYDFSELDDFEINLEEFFVDAAKDVGFDITQDVFIKYGGPAGGALNGIFVTDKYVNYLYEVMALYKTGNRVPSITIHINEQDDSLVDQGVIVENKQGDSLSNDELRVEDVTSASEYQYIYTDLKQCKIVTIYDISLYRNNELIQPNGLIGVKIPLPVNFSAENAKIFRAEKDGSYTDMNAVYEDGYLFFETNHLSIYLLAEVEQTVIFNENNKDAEIELCFSNDNPVQSDTLNIVMINNSSEQVEFAVEDFSITSDKNKSSIIDGMTITGIGSCNAGETTLEVTENFEFTNGKMNNAYLWYENICVGEFSMKRTYIPEIKLYDETAIYNNKIQQIDNVEILCLDGSNQVDEVNYVYYVDDACTQMTSDIHGAEVEGGAPKNVGVYYVKANIDANENYMSAESNIVSFTILQKEISIKASDQCIEYGMSIDTNLDNNTISISGVSEGHKISSVLLEADSIEVTEDGAIIPSNAVIIDENGKEVTENYKINYYAGKLMIREAAIQVLCSGYQGIYDGNAHSIMVNVTYPMDTQITYSTDGETYSEINPQFIDKGTYTVYYKIEKEGYNTISGEGIITIDALQITIKADSQSIIEGDEIDKSMYWVEGKLCSDHILSVLLTPSTSIITNNGVIIVSDANIVNADGKDVTDNYDITYISGRLEITERLSIEYEILNGKDGTWSGEKEGLTICGSGDFSKFVDVKIDGAIIATDCFSLEEGSTLITLYANYLETLSSGIHTIEIVWTDGTASATFTILEKEDAGVIEDTEDVEDIENVGDTEDVEDTENVKDTENVEETEDIENTENIENQEEIEETEHVEKVDDRENLQDVEDTEDTVPMVSKADNNRLIVAIVIILVIGIIIVYTGWKKRDKKS